MSTFMFPQIQRVRQRFDHPVVTDIEGSVIAQIEQSRLSTRVPAGSRVAVAVGSRGIANLARIVTATITGLKRLRYEPFVVAAMGTHGGGTPAGQRQVLADYGVTDAAIGAPIRCDMESTVIGTNKFGLPVYWDRNALAADAVVAVNRIKAHTDFTGPFESGILKMLVIGLGKRESPLQVHALGSGMMHETIQASGRVVLEQTKFALGIAALENAAEQTALIQAIEPEALYEVEPKLLLTAKQWMGRLPFDEADVLIVGELGKNYSGTGMDPNVLGRRLVETEGDFPSPRIVRIAVLDISAESHGNSIGSGLADLTTRRFVDGIDHHSVNLNTLTARLLQRARVPITLPTDRDVIRTAIQTCWQPEPTQVKLAIIPNTLEVAELYVTAPLAAACAADGAVLTIDPPIDVPFRTDDRLDQPRLFPHALVGRRARGVSASH